MSLRCSVIMSKSELIRLEMNDMIAYEYPEKQRLLYQNAGKREDLSNSMVLKKRQYGTCPHCKNILENSLDIAIGEITCCICAPQLVTS